jgi:hypothetical protein
LSRPPDPGEERRRIFRRMEYVFVYAPPLLALFFGLSGAAFLAFIAPIPGTSYWGRWAIFVGVLLVLPTLAYLVWHRFRGDD